MTAPTPTGAPASASDAVVIPKEIETAISEYGVARHSQGYEADRGGWEDPDTPEKALLALRRSIAAALASPPAVVPESVRQLADRLRAWSENDPDPNYFFGDGDDVVFSAMQLDCAAASEALLLSTPSARADTHTVSGGVVDELTEDEILRRAKAMVLDQGWKPGDQMSGHTVAGLMTRFGLSILRQPPEDRCAYPACSCDHDAMCGNALAAAPAAPEPAAGGGRETAASAGAIAHHAHSLEIAAKVLHGLAKSASAGSCEKAAAFLRSLLSAPSQAETAGGGGLSQAARDVLAERRRQIEVKGWTPQHDDRHRDGAIALASAAYIYGSQYPDDLREAGGRPAWWPWDMRWWKPTDRRRDLVKGLALGLAEIDRLDRLSEPTPANAGAEGGQD